MFPLDAKNELGVSTFPSHFARTGRHIPFVYKELESPNSVNFQLGTGDADAEL